MGVGVHFGPAVLGLIGSAQHRSYTALGGTVNMASRMEGMTKPLGASVLISSKVAQRLAKDGFVLRPLGRYAPKGAVVPLECFDVHGEQRDMVWTPSFREELEASRLAAECTEGGHFQDARAHLERAVELSTGTSRETGYRLRLTSITQGDRFVRLAEK
jgi:hypothetical protein